MSSLKNALRSRFRSDKDQEEDVSTTKEEMEETDSMADNKSINTQVSLPSLENLLLCMKLW